MKAENVATLNHLISMLQDYSRNSTDPTPALKYWMINTDASDVDAVCRATFTLTGTDGTVIKGNILCAIIHLMKGRLCINAMRLFINAGANINAKVVLSAPNQCPANISLAQYACRFLNADNIIFLGENGEDLLSVTNMDATLLHFASIKYDLTSELVNKLSKQKIKELIAINLDNEDSIFNFLLNSFELIPIAELLRSRAPELYENAYLSEKAIKNIAYMALSRAEYQDLANKNKSIQKKSLDNLLLAASHWHKENKFSDDAEISLVRRCMVKPETEEKRKTAVYQLLTSVLTNEANLKKLLEILSSRLVRQIIMSGKIIEFQKLSQDFSVQVISDYLYPIPGSTFTKTAKDKILPQVLIEILNSAGLAQTTSKWYGFIPSEIANDRVGKGEFFIESQFGLTLLHGKYSHMIQWALMVLAVEEGIVSLPEGLTIKEVITALPAMNANLLGSKGSTWNIMLDASNKDSFCFRDPYRVTSLISTGYFGQGCKMLEVYLRDSFCSDFLQWFNAYNAASQRKVDMKFFVKLLHLNPLHIIQKSLFCLNAQQSRTEEKLARAKNGEYTSTKSMTLFGDDKQCIIIEKDYSNPSPRSLTSS